MSKMDLANSVYAQIIINIGIDVEKAHVHNFISEIEDMIDSIVLSNAMDEKCEDFYSCDIGYRTCP